MTIGGSMGGDEDVLSIPRYILEDSPKLRKKFEQFADAEARATEAMVTIGAVDDIVTFHEQAKHERDEADRISAETRATCDKLLVDTGKEAKGILFNAQASADEVSALSESLRIDASRISSEAQVLMKKAKEQADEVASDRRKNDADAVILQQKADELENREQELDGEREKYAEVRVLINKIF